MNPELAQLTRDMAHLKGTLEGGMIVLQWGLAIIGGLLTLLIGSVVYSFKRQAAVVETLRKRTHRIINFCNLVAGKLGLPAMNGNGE